MRNTRGCLAFDKWVSKKLCPKFIFAQVAFVQVATSLRLKPRAEQPPTRQQSAT